MIRSKTTLPAAQWGDGCDAWALLSDPSLSVKLEHMPSGTREVRHRHARAQQFFFVLSGVLKIDLNGEVFALGNEEGLSVAAGLPHQVINEGSGPVTFLVISSPPTEGDRVEIG